MCHIVVLQAKHMVERTAADRPTGEYLAHHGRHGRLAPREPSPFFHVVAGLPVDGPALVASVALSRVISRHRGRGRGRQLFPGGRDAVTACRRW